MRKMGEFKVHIPSKREIMLRPLYAFGKCSPYRFYCQIIIHQNSSYFPIAKWLGSIPAICYSQQV
jgi:hypothetical protein